MTDAVGSETYRPFASFSEWVDADVGAAWDEFLDALNAERETATPADLEAAFNLAVRSAALETGAIEGLYATTRGITRTVALQGAMWEGELEKLGSEVRAHFEAQLSSFELVLDAVTGKLPLSEAWLRELHAKVCGAQATYTTWSEAGRQEQPLPHGQYKISPNNVTLHDGTIHWYAQPHDVVPEMHRLVTEVDSDAFRDAHPVIQAAYAHHAVTAVHPFADGNGRTARALASVFLYKAAGVPLVIFSDQQVTYFDALEEADAGRFRTFVTFIDDRALDTMALVTDRLRDARNPLDRKAANVRKLLIAHGGLTHAQIQAVGGRLSEHLVGQFNEILGELDLQQPDVFWGCESGMLTRSGIGLSARFENLPYHEMASGGHSVLFLESHAPFRVDIDTLITVGISNDTANPFAFIVVDTPRRTNALRLRVGDLHPAISAAAEARIEGWVRAVIFTALDEFYETFSSRKRELGYS